MPAPRNILQEAGVTRQAVISYRAASGEELAFAALEIAGKWYDLQQQKLTLEIIASTNAGDRKVALDIKSSRFVREFSTFIDRESVRWTARAASILRNKGQRAGEALEAEGADAALDAVADAPSRASPEPRVARDRPTGGRAGERLDREGRAAGSVYSGDGQLAEIQRGRARCGISRTRRGPRSGTQIRVGVSQGEGRQQIADRIVKHHPVDHAQRPNDRTYGSTHGGELRFARRGA